MPRFFLPILILLAACGSREEPPVDARDEESDPFQIVLGEVDALPDMPPAIVGDTLLVRVQYPGDCTDHSFALRSSVRQDTTVLTLRHDAEGDRCEAMVYDELRLPLPGGVPSEGLVLLRNPEGGAPFIVRQ